MCYISYSIKRKKTIQYGCFTDERYLRAKKRNRR